MLCADVAERTGFEPAIPCGMLAFQASAFDHSTISPKVDCRKPYKDIKKIPISQLQICFFANSHKHSIATSKPTLKPLVNAIVSLSNSVAYCSFANNLKTASCSSFSRLSLGLEDYMQ